MTGKTDKSKWRTISIPSTMYEAIERIIKTRQDLGFTSVSEFIKDAIREKLISTSPRMMEATELETRILKLILSDDELKQIIKKKLYEKGESL